MLKPFIARVLRALANRLDPLPEPPAPVQWTYTLSYPSVYDPTYWTHQSETTVTP